LRIHEVPVDWIDDPDSRVDIIATAVADLKGVARLARGLASGAIPVAELAAQFRSTREPLDGEMDAAAGPSARPGFVAQVLRFAMVGVASTVAYLLLFVVLRAWMPAQLANALALLATAMANTAANRRFTFAVHGPGRAVRHQLQGLAVFVAALLVTSGSLALLHAAAPTASRALEACVLVAANLVATALRFVLFRSWVFAGAMTTKRSSP
jgi:putative flippase GtrA